MSATFFTVLTSGPPQQLDFALPRIFLTVLYTAKAISKIAQIMMIVAISPSTFCP